jgi:3-oxoacyl-[acyl-carrier protein] reductase
MKLENKKALITGASRGIGKAIADRFITESADVWGLSTTEPEDFGSRVEKSGGKLHWISADLSALDTLEALMENVIKESGGFDILVNNAGITKDNLAFRMGLDDFRNVIDVNLHAAFIIARTAGRDIIKKKAGSIINMSSVSGLHGNGGQVNYAASKAALVGLTKSLARETASRNVRVNAIAPGFITTDMTSVLPDKIKETMLEQIPLKRMGTPEDIAAAALALGQAEPT